MCNSKHSMVRINNFSTLGEKVLDKPWDDRHVPKHTTFAIYTIYTFVLYGRKTYTLTLIRFLYINKAYARGKKMGRQAYARGKKMGRHLSKQWANS